MAMERLRVGVLGATGIVGQWLMQLLDQHPWFTVSALVASGRSAGRLYQDAVSWRLETPIPESVSGITVQGLDESLECDLVISALESSVAGAAEERFAEQGFPVLSNARNHRMDADVPLLIPEVNWEHVRMIPLQRSRRGYESGFIVTNPNCSTVGLVMALKPLMDRFGISEVSVVTMQAISGAGLDGVAAGAIHDNVIPYVSAEEEKLETEPLKILGDLDGHGFSPAHFHLSAQCNRVPVLEGHTEAVSVRLRSPATQAEVSKALASFQSEPQRLDLPSAPAHPVLVSESVDRPQPRLDRSASRGMAVTVGHIRPCPVLDWKFTLVVHNVLRGAAGAALLNAELLAAQGYLGPRERPDPTDSRPD